LTAIALFGDSGTRQDRPKHTHFRPKIPSFLNYRVSTPPFLPPSIGRQLPVSDAAIFPKF
jgi:hypothetical protein